MANKNNYLILVRVTPCRLVTRYAIIRMCVVRLVCADEGVGAFQTGCTMVRSFIVAACWCVLVNIGQIYAGKPGMMLRM